MQARCAAALIPLLVVAAACAETGRPIEGTTPEPAQEEIAPVANRRVRATNDHASAVIIHAVMDGRSWRLGQVETGRTLTFTLPPSEPEADVQLVVVPVASDADYATGTLSLEPGSTIELTIGGDLGLSSYRVVAY